MFSDLVVEQLGLFLFDLNQFLVLRGHFLGLDLLLEFILQLLLLSLDLQADLPLSLLFLAHDFFQVLLIVDLFFLLLSDQPGLFFHQAALYGRDILLFVIGQLDQILFVRFETAE